MAKKRVPSRTTEQKSGQKDATERRELSADEKLYTRNVLIRGEAAKASKSGELPPDATHEIVEEAAAEGELPKIRRRRFSAF
jgi:hypothetical protein